MLSIILRRCPHCRKGPVFKKLFTMYSSCPDCSFVYDREPGYYTGAMFINWFLAIGFIGPVWVTMILLGYKFTTIFVSTVIPLVLATPWLFQYSRILWLYLDYQISGPGNSRPGS